MKIKKWLIEEITFPRWLIIFLAITFHWAWVQAHILINGISSIFYMFNFCYKYQIISNVL